uniref:DUF2428 domain-containing protein n=1 Tax=Denticeps clupeoides TaxID=299321 RepID=A0AAY4CHN4_9TELE
MSRVMISVEEARVQVQVLLASVLRDDKNILNVFFDRLTECTRPAKRCKERALDQALQLLRNLPREELRSLEAEQLASLVRLLVAMLLDMATISTACRKLDQILQLLAQFGHRVVREELQRCVQILLRRDQKVRICMMLEDCTLAREALRQECALLLGKVSEVFPAILREESSRNGTLCYQAVKVCLQMFQLLPQQVCPFIFGIEKGNSVMQGILKYLMDIILGGVSLSNSRDIRILAGTAVAMMISISSESEDGKSAACSLLQVTRQEPWMLTMGGLHILCEPRCPDGVDRLAITRGLLTGCRKDILTSRFDPEGTCLLLDGLFPVVTALCEEKLDCHYLVFQVFTMWLKSVKECLPDIWNIVNAPVLGKGSILQHKLFQVIWNNAESPVEGVSEYVRGAFGLFVEIYDLDCRCYGDTERTLLTQLLQQITELPWETKAKYPLLCVLLPYVGTYMVLEQYPDLPTHLLKCLSTNHLSPCASDVYKCFIQQQRKELCQNRDVPPSETEAANHWGQHWKTSLLEALTSEVTLLQNNASSHLLPCTLRTVPSAFEVLLSSLAPTSRGDLRAWACIMSSHRATSGGSPWFSEDSPALETLRRALSSLDDGVRLAAFNLLCSSPKSKELPSLVELSAMKNFIPMNLNSESSPFRQHLHAGVKRFLVRIRDSCLSKLVGSRNKGHLSVDKERDLREGVEFVDWLAHQAFTHLTMGSSYQRKKTALLLLAAILEVCTDTWSPDKKKGQPPANMSCLITWARQRGQWDFFSRSKQLVLISSLEDATNEIRDSAAELLLRFFPSCFPDDVVPVLFRRVDGLLHSPRVQEAQMGALMMKMLLQNVVGLVQGDKTATLTKHLLHLLEQHYVVAKRDMLLASRTKPIHGIVAALQRCLLEVPGTLAVALELGVVQEMVFLLQKIALFLLGVLYGDQDTDGKEVPPSFCDMGNAISSVIGQGTDTEDPGEECVLLSEEHSLVLTCCWVSLKEVGIFLGSLVEMTMGQADDLGASMTAEDLKVASKIFKDIILKCRHWGAVEGCCVGFTKFCRALLGSADPELRDIPADMLREGLGHLQTPRGTSVTRRAAGLPMLVLCVVAAEESSQSRPLLSLSVSSLLVTASTPVPGDWDQTLDLPQVCAVHTLQALVRGSGLGVAILQHASAMAILSLKLLSSTCWAMRNAALQLYSSLSSRMLGQQPAGDWGSCHYGMSPSAFFTHYPSLLPFLLHKLQGAAQDLQDSAQHARFCLHPALHPVLTLLAKLQCGVQHRNSSLLEFLAPLLQLASSPVYGIRVMASKALCAMTPPSEYSALLQKLAEELAEFPEKPCYHNLLHGQLLQMRELLTRALTTSSAWSDLAATFESRLWLAMPVQQCPLVKGVYVEVAGLLRRHLSESFLHQLASLLRSELHMEPHRLQVGSASFHQTAVHFLCKDPTWGCQVWRGFCRESPVVRLSLVKWATENHSWSGTVMQQELERALLDNLKRALLDEDVEYRGAYLAALLAVMTARVNGEIGYTAAALLPVAELHECLEILLKAMESLDGGPEYLSQALRVASLLLSRSLEPTLLLRWCCLLEMHRDAEAPEALRMACAQSLSLAGTTVVYKSLRVSCALQEISTRVISTGLYLLQDESHQVRVETSIFVSTLTSALKGRDEQPVFLVHVNQSLLLLLDLLLGELWDSCGTLEAMLCHLPEISVSSMLRDAQETQCSSLYEQDEANVFAEPSAISECLLPYLLQLAQKSADSAALAQQFSSWAKQNTANVLENLSVCRQLGSVKTLDRSWLGLLSEPRFHSAVGGLFTRAAFLCYLLELGDDLQPLCDPSTLAKNLLELHHELALKGLFLSQAFISPVRALYAEEGSQKGPDGR